MKKGTIISMLILLSYVNCVKEDSTRACYTFTNETDRSVKMETYRYNSAGVFLQEEYQITGIGIIAEGCDVGMGLPLVTDVYRVDSIAVKFDDMRLLFYTGSQGENQTIDPIFFSEEWERENNTNNFFWRFTEQDYNNAMPY